MIRRIDRVSNDELLLMLKIGWDFAWNNAWRRASHDDIGILDEFVHLTPDFDF